jgi:hypothetical protein
MDACVALKGTPSDLDLLGHPRTHPARCCPSRYGFDAELARTRCGFAEYLGESEELACVHRFRGTDDRIHELRLTPIVGLELDAAVRAHDAGEFGPDHTDATPADLDGGTWWSTAGGRWWAFVPGWSVVRRLSWDEAACGPEQMLPVLARMREAPNDPEAEVALPRVIDELAHTSSDSTPAISLLQQASPTPASSTAARRFPLPRAATQLIHELLAAASADDLAQFTALLDADARIGLPDRRQLGAEPIHTGAGPRAAARRLVDGAARFAVTTPLVCPTIDRRARATVTRGDALMWCFWMSEDGLDLLSFGLRGRVIESEGDARVAYIGVFPLRPEAPLVVPGEPPPPPVVPAPVLVCGDPHAETYPGVCPVNPEP